MEDKVIALINTAYKILTWISLILAIVLLLFTIRVHKDMEKERKIEQRILEQTVNRLIEKRLTRPIKGS